jgi:hypothetical protein
MVSVLLRVGFLCAFIVLIFGISFGHAQTPGPGTFRIPKLTFPQIGMPSQPTTVAPIDTFRQITSQVQQFIAQFANADLQSAIDDANSQVPPDTQGAACWTDLQQLLPPTIPEGAAVAYLIQKARDFDLKLAKAGADCSFSPKLVQAMLQLSVALKAFGP